MSGPDSVNDASRGLAVPLTAGRELDALVAERIFGYRRESYSSRDYDGVLHEGEVLMPPGTTWRDVMDYFPKRGPIPRLYWVSDEYTKSFSGAFAVENAMRQRGWSLTLWYVRETDDWHANFATDGDGGTGAEADSAPLAICRAALAALASGPLPTEKGLLPEGAE